MTSSSEEIEEEGKVREILATVERRSKPFMMNREAMMRVGFDVKVQVVRVIVCLILLQIVTTFDVRTPASQLDQTWLLEFFTLALMFFIFINCVFLLALAADAPHIIYVVLRVFGGTIIALI